jgi:hypothetical protein
MSDPNDTARTAPALPLDSYVILHTHLGPSYPTTHIATNGPFALSDDMRIETLDTDFAKKVIRACEPPHHHITTDVRDIHLYAFVRKIPKTLPPPGTAMPSHYHLRPLLTAVALSRLVRPTSTGDRYVAQVFPYSDDPAIQAIQMSDVCPDVYTGDAKQDWLSPEDGDELRELMMWISEEHQMLERVQRAFWHHDTAMRTYYLDSRWTFIAAGLEALLTVEETNVRFQFKSRASRLAAEVGVDLSPDEALDAYTVRSKLGHGQEFLFGIHRTIPADKHRPLYDKLETTLRLAVKRCLLDSSFAKYFASAENVNDRWPCCSRCAAELSQSDPKRISIKNGKRLCEPCYTKEAKARAATSRTH